jgi:Hypothetical glycosyl hydrolase family 15
MRRGSILGVLCVSLTAALGCGPAKGDLANTVAPKISGVPTVGDTLTVTHGTWTGSPTSYTYQWQDCNPRGTGCSNITRAASTRYRVASRDTLSSIRAVVTAHNASGSASASGITGPEPAQFSWISFSGRGLSSRCRADSVKANRYQIIGLQSNESHAPKYVSCLHADNPHVKVIVYVDSIATKISDRTDAGSCTGYGTDNRQAITHPGDPTEDWFLHDDALSSVNPANETSSRIGYRGSSDQILLDVGLSAYWRACESHAVSLANGDAANGLLWDNVIAHRNFVGIENSPAYPTDAAWEGAENDWASHAAAGVHKTYRLFQIANIAGGQWDREDPTFRTDIVSKGQLDGSMEESWTDGGEGPAQQITDWKGKLGDAMQAEAADKYYEAHNNYAGCSSSPCGNESADTYSLASLLLAANGHSSFITADGQCYSACEAWWPEYDTALQLGPATGSYQTRTDRRGHTFYERDFANGVALANPSQNSIVSFYPTPGGKYSGRSCTPRGSYPTTSSTCSTLSGVRAVRLRPDQGLILLKTGSPTRS